MKSIHDRIILKEIPTENVGAIAITSMARNNLMEVVSVGRGRLLDDGSYVPPSVKPGDRVLINENAGSELHNEDGVFWVVRDKDILGVME